MKSLKEMASQLKASLGAAAHHTFEDFQTQCPTCNSPLSGHRQKDAEGRVLKEWVDECFVCETKRMRQQAKHQAAQRNAQSGMLGAIPVLLQDANFEAADPRIAQQAKIVRAFANSVLEHKDTPVKTLLFQGGYGLGKSWLAAACVNYIQAHGGTAGMLDAVDLALTVRSAWTKQQSPEDVYEAFMTPDLLVIDELGTPESLRDNLASAWGRVIQKRFDNALPMILITNLSYEEMVRHVDHRLVDRIFSNRFSYQLRFSGQSFRNGAVSASTGMAH